MLNLPQVTCEFKEVMMTKESAVYLKEGEEECGYCRFCRSSMAYSGDEFICIRLGRMEAVEVDDTCEEWEAYDE